mmetsp:Transcript_57564/g.171651  ORF Transcript_57564/g.171651 Transcript_57564/m.171651 type:complete len:224 (-) Transcript_57564:973-1644(-)
MGRIESLRRQAHSPAFHPVHVRFTLPSRRGRRRTRRIEGHRRTIRGEFRIFGRRNREASRGVGGYEEASGGEGGEVSRRGGEGEAGHGTVVRRRQGGQGRRRQRLGHVQKRGQEGRRRAPPHPALRVEFHPLDRCALRRRRLLPRAMPRRRILLFRRPVPLAPVRFRPAVLRSANAVRHCIDASSGRIPLVQIGQGDGRHENVREEVVQAHFNRRYDQGVEFR